MFGGRVAVLGTGLVGSSVGLRLRKEHSLQVAGYDADPDAAAAAQEVGAVTEVAPSAAAAVVGAGLVVLSAPVDRIAQQCEELADAVPPEAVVTDVGSAKSAVVARGEAAFGERFVGGHPMAGSERHGARAADEALFEDAWWILTPTAKTSSAAYSTVAQLVAALGARPIAVEPEVHDALVARISHLPQLAASALVTVAADVGEPDRLLHLAASGFRDVTRIAASNPDLWVAIVRANRAAVLDALGRMNERLDEVAGLVEGGRWSELRDLLEAARSARLELFAKPGYAGEPVELAMLVPDRPGVLAEVTTEAGRLGANIEDLRIIHSPEGGRGRLELVIAGEEPAEQLTEALTRLGYHVQRPGIGD